MRCSNTRGFKSHSVHFFIYSAYCNLYIIFLNILRALMDFLYFCCQQSPSEQFNQKKSICIYFQEFLYFDYTYIYTCTPMDSDPQEIKNIRTQNKGQQSLQAQPNSQNMPQNHVIQEVKAYICYAKLSEKEKTIKNLEQQLKDKQVQKEKMLKKHMQDLQNLENKKSVEKGQIVRQMCNREKQIQKKVEEIKQTERRREESFEQIRKLFTDSNHAIQTYNQQIFDRMQLSRQNNDQNLTIQKKMISQSSEITTLKQKLQFAENKNKTLEDKLRNSEIYLATINAKDNSRQVEYRNKNAQLDKQYQYLKESVHRQNKRLEQSQKRQAEQFQQQIKIFKEYKQKNELQLNKMIDSQKELKNTLQKIRRQNEALQKRQNQQKLKMDQLTQEKNKLSNKLQQKIMQQQQQIKRLKQDLIRKEQIIAQFKTSYDKKLNDLAISYSNFQKQQKENYEIQKRKIQSQCFNKIYQLNQNITDRNKDKENLKKVYSQLQEASKNQQQLCESKINSLEQEIKKYKNFIYQFKLILNAETRISNKTEDPEEILNHLKLLVKNLKDTAAANKSQEQKAKQTTSSFIQLNESNRLMLAKLVQNVKNIDNYRKMKEQPDNKYHLGLLINTLADSIISLIGQKENMIKQKLKIIQATQNTNKSLSKDLKIIKSNFALLNKKQISIQIQNRTLKLNAESNNIQKEKMKDKKQELNPSIESQIRQMKQQLQKSKNQTQQQKRISKQLRIQIQMLKNKNQSEQLMQKIGQLNKNIQSLNKDINIQKELNRAQNKKLEQQKERNKTLQLNITLRNKELEKFKQDMKQKELNLKQSFDQSLIEISQALEEVSGSELQNKETHGIVSFIRKNGCSSSNSNTSFTVSEILQNLPKQRSFLVDECCKFLGAEFISTKLSFKYDQNFKNFSFYLPTLANKFLFAVILKTKKNVVFGIISTFIGRDSKAFAYNLNTRKIMNKSPRAKISSTYYQSSMLKFGNDEIVIRNNSNLEARVNTMILGERYFDFTKEDLVGKGEAGDYIQLESFQIHKIIAV